MGQNGYKRTATQDTPIFFPVQRSVWLDLNLFVHRPTESPYDMAPSFLLNLNVEQRAQFKKLKDEVNNGTGLVQEMARQRFSKVVDELLMFARQRIEAKRTALEERMATVCTVDTHTAVQGIRLWYPNYEPQGNIEL